MKQGGDITIICPPGAYNSTEEYLKAKYDFVYQTLISLKEKSILGGRKGILKNPFASYGEMFKREKQIAFTTNQDNKKPKKKTGKKAFSNGMTQEEAIALLKDDIKSRGEAAVQSKITVKLSRNQYDAFTIFNFNTGGLIGSTLQADINAGVTDETKIRGDFGMWNKGKINGKKIVIPGLINRRKAEANVYYK